MPTLTNVRRLIPVAVVTLVMPLGIAIALAQTPQTPAAAPEAKPQPVKGVAIRGCLTGTKLTHIESPSSAPALPNTLKVTTIRVIRDQLKPLNGHQVELIGTLRGVPGQENGILISDSDKAKVYLGGSDKNLGEDSNVTRNEPPTIHAHTIRDLAPTCTAVQPK